MARRPSSRGPRCLGFFLLLAAPGLAVRSAAESEPDSDSNGTVENIATEVVEGLESALEGDTDNETDKKINKTYQFFPGQFPGVDIWCGESYEKCRLQLWEHGELWQMVDRWKVSTESPHTPYWIKKKLIAWNASTLSIQSFAGNPYLKKIDDVDVKGYESQAQIVHRWAGLVNGARHYDVVVEWDMGNMYGEGQPKPLLFKLLFGVLVAGLGFAFLTGLFMVCSLPCFLCRQCSIRGAYSLLTAVPAGPEEDDSTTSNSAAPQLDRSLLMIRLTDSLWFQASLLVLSATGIAVLSWECSENPRLIRDRRMIAAAFLAFSLSWLFQAIAVLWGLKATKEVKLLAKGIECPLDVNALTVELQNVAFAFAPKLVPTILIGMGLLPATATTVLSFFHAAVHSFQSGLSFFPLYVPGFILLACECALTSMTCCFILEALVVARTAESLVEAVRKDLIKHTKDFVDPDDLKRIHADCGHLANHVLPELARISKPTLGLVALKIICACSSVIPCMFFVAVATTEDLAVTAAVFPLALAWYILSDLLLAFLCLLLPASVSDACANLVKELNDCRVRPFKEGCEAQVVRQIQLTELYLEKHNRGQGLGFVLAGFGTVIDKKMILSVFAKFLALSSVMLTVLRKAYEEPRRQLQEEQLLRRVSGGH